MWEIAFPPETIWTEPVINIRGYANAVLQASFIAGRILEGERIARAQVAAIRQELDAGLAD